MKKFWIVFKYEFNRQVKNKIFVGITALFIVASVIGSFFIASKIDEISNAIDNPEDVVVEEVEASDIYVFAQGDMINFIKQLNDTKMYNVVFVDNEADLENIVIENDGTGLIVNSYTDITKIVSKTSMISDFGQIDQILNTMSQNQYLLDKGLSMEDVYGFHESRVNIEVVNVGVDGVVGYGFVYAYTMLLYMTVMLYGSVVSTSIITEKTSKAMELLITSANSTALVAGKVFAVGVSCIIQLASVIAAFVISLNVFVKSNILGELISMLGDNVVAMLALGLVLFIIGFFSILFLFAGFSSFGTKPEDANTLIMPLIVILVAVFMVNLMSIQGDILNTPVFRVLTYTPIVSPFLMFSRFALYGLSTVELIMGLIANILGGALLIWFAAKIYRAGTLHYGNSIKLLKVFKSIKSK